MIVSVTVGTETGDALIGVPVGTAAAGELPERESVVRIPARDVSRMFYGIGPDTFKQVTPWA